MQELHSHMIRLYYILKLIGRGLRLRPWGSVLTLLACWFALCQLSLVFSAVDIADRASTLPATSGAMVAYIREGTPQAQIAGLEKTIGSREEVARVQFISQEQGLEKMKKWLGSESPLVEDVDPQILPAAFEITLHREYADKAAQGAREISRMTGVNDVRYRKGLIGSIAGSFTQILIGASLIGAIVVVCLALVIFLSIRVGIVSRKQEIEVMKMLGATSFFIYAPYIIEGTTYGLIGSGAALSTTSLAFHYIHVHYPVLLTLMQPFTVYQVTGVIFFACFCSVGGAMMAIQRSVDV